MKKAISKTKKINKGNIEKLEGSIKKIVDKIDGFTYPLIIPPLLSIDEDILFEIYPDLLKIGNKKKLNILLYSYGGDAHTAFHIGRLLQAYSEELNVFILREAKSAATLISCAADKIIFTDISELGPMDPQIKRTDLSERYSPLAIKHTFDLLGSESKAGHDGIVKALTEKLPDPLILGEHLKSLETGKDYIGKLLAARMLKDKEPETIKAVAEQLVTGYPDHGYCIDLIEAQHIGLIAERNDSSLDEDIFCVMKHYKNVWKDFEQNIRSKEDQKKKEALDTYIKLKKLATNIIAYQLQKAEAFKRQRLMNKAKEN